MEELKYRLGEDHPTYQSEHMATLFGLLCRATEELAGEEVFGRVIPWCVARYGRERGSRMAQRCLADGRPLTMLNYRCYSEWRPQPGTHQHNLISRSPVYSTMSTTCSWNDAWKKHGLSKYGPYYCNYVDKNLVWGFNPSIDLKIHSFLSEGADGCHFEWTGLEMTPENEELMAKTKAELGDRYVKNFEYHTAHAYFTMGRVLREELGEELAGKILQKKLADYEAIFGKEHTSFLRLKKVDFTRAC